MFMHFTLENKAYCNFDAANYIWKFYLEPSLIENPLLNLFKEKSNYANTLI